MATATANLLHGAVRALRSTSGAPFAWQSTMMASNLWRVSFRKTACDSEHNSRLMSRSPNTRRKTRTILSSEHKTNDFKAMGRTPQVNCQELDESTSV